MPDVPSSGSPPSDPAIAGRAAAMMVDRAFWKHCLSNVEESRTAPALVFRQKRKRIGKFYIGDVISLNSLSENCRLRV
jgi:hypothetical protein